MLCFRECLNSTRLSIVVRTALVRLRLAKEQIQPSFFILIGLSLLLSCCSFTLLILSFLLFLCFLVISRLVPGWEFSWGVPLGHFLPSEPAKLGKGKFLMSKAMGKIAGMVPLGCHRFGDNLSYCCKVQVTVQPLCTASPLNYAHVFIILFYFKFNFIIFIVYSSITRR